jgi:hypothetical protein
MIPLGKNILIIGPQVAYDVVYNVCQELTKDTSDSFIDFLYGCSGIGNEKI